MKTNGIKIFNSYIIYENGQLFSLISNKFIKPNKDKNGYFLYHLYINRKRKIFKAHRLVATYFIGTPKNENLVVNHIDGNKQNNNVSNLEWITRKQNGEHAAKNNLVAKEFDFNRTKLSDKQCLKILELRYENKYSFYKIADIYNVSFQLIHLICTGKTRTRVYNTYFKGTLDGSN